MKRTALLLLATAYLGVIWSFTAQAGYQYTILDYPGAAGTGALGMDGGTIVGAYFPSGAMPCDPGVGRAFKYGGGVWTPLDYPGSVQGSAEDIQGANIVGGWYDSACVNHGYLFDGSAWTSLDYPGTRETWASAIYGRNIVGNFWSGGPGYHPQGYLYTGGSWTTINYPGAADTHPRGIEGSNVVGEYTDSRGLSHGFLYNGGAWLTLDYPGANMTSLNRIKGGTILGWYESTTGNYHGLLYTNGTWTTFDFPGATNTYLTGTDGSGGLVGFYEDSTGMHGFLATPSAAATLTLTESGTGFGAVTSTPSGIDCGATCSASYASSTSLALTASPSSGSCFIGWGTPCSGYGTCNLTLTTDTALTATFQPIGSNFCDVTPGTWAENYINTILSHNVTTGCVTATSPQDRRYCPSDLVTRAQMAAFIIRAKEGEPPSTYCAAGSAFTDGDQNDWSCKYIKRLKELNLTTGYGGDPTIYMPNLTIPRDQMAAFIIRAREGEPPDNYCEFGSVFTDVAASDWSCKYIKRLKELHLTTGYGGDPTIYQPALMVPREQMAAFLGRAFYGMQ